MLLNQKEPLISPQQSKTWAHVILIETCCALKSQSFLYFQCHDSHAEASSTEECCSSAVEAAVRICSGCRLSKLFTGLACGPLFPVHQVCNFSCWCVFSCDVTFSLKRVCFSFFNQAFVWMCTSVVSPWALSSHFHRLVSKRLSPCVRLTYGHSDDGTWQLLHSWESHFKKNLIYWNKFTELGETNPSIN